jgi:hypothetical protein
MRIPSESLIFTLLGNITKASEEFLKKLEEQIKRIRAGIATDSIKKPCCGKDLKELKDAQGKVK